MSWYGWLALAVSLTGWFLTWRSASWILAKDLSIGGKPRAEDIAFGLFVGALAALLWPVVVPLYQIHKRGRLVGVGFALVRPPKEERKQMQVKALQARIAELEREAGIRG